MCVGCVWVWVCVFVCGECVVCVFGVGLCVVFVGVWGVCKFGTRYGCVCPARLFSVNKHIISFYSDLFQFVENRYVPSNFINQDMA